MNDRSSESVAWAAGLFEGEGYVHARKDGGTEIGLEMCDEDVVRRFAQIVGVGNVTARAERKGWQAAYAWRSSDRWDVADVLQTLRPFMGRRRKRKADEALGRIQARMK
jgi:hypothetical protein